MVLTQRQKNGLDKLINQVKSTFSMTKKGATQQHKSVKLNIAPFKEDTDSVQVIEIYMPEYVDDKGNMRSIIIGVNNNGEYAFGVRNKYGNSFRTIPYSALQNLFWGSNPKDDTTALENLETIRNSNGVVSMAPLTDEIREENWKKHIK